MRFITNIASFCLHLPCRLYDLIAIVLISTGINVVTGAGGSEHESLAILSGFSLCGAGVFASFLKGWTDRIIQAVESSAEIMADENATTNANKNPPIAPVPDVSSPDDDESRKSPLDVVIEGHLKDKPGDAAIVTKLFAFLLLLVALGVFGTIRANYADENTGFSKKLENAAAGIHEKVQSECVRITNDLAALSRSSSNNHSLLVEHTAARFQDVTLQLESLKADIASLSTLISNHANRSGADPEAGEHAAEE